MAVPNRINRTTAMILARMAREKKLSRGRSSLESYIARIPRDGSGDWDRGRQWPQRVIKTGDAKNDGRKLNFLIQNDSIE